jgi:hypothetical protein
MAGLAGALNAPGSIDALAEALSPRGADCARCQLESVKGGVLDVIMRAGLPSVTRVVSERDVSRLIAAFAVDGVASATALDADYTACGPPGLLGGPDPYSVVLADAEGPRLVLARNGDGPGLYYARVGAGWLVASEPGALVAAGVPAEPDVEVVRSFVERGECDNTERTFFASIWRVLPGEVVVLTAGGGLQTVVRSPVAGGITTTSALVDATAGGRLAVLMGAGRAGAALLATALSRKDRVRPLPVHTATFPGLDSPASHTPAALVPIPFGMVRHVPHTFDPADLDFDAFLADIGEPVPDAGAYVLWAVARTLDEGVGTLVDSSTGPPDGFVRVADRILARYGVLVRTPLRTVGQPGGTTEAELDRIAKRNLPSAARRYAAKDSAGPITAREIVAAQQRAVAAALATCRPWSDPAANVDSLRRLRAGEPVDAEALLRAFLVERWLSQVAPPQVPVPTVGPADVKVRGRTWQRVLIATDAVGPGDQLLAKAAWTVLDAVAELQRDESYRDSLRGPWFAVLAGKPLSVSQRRIRPLWEIDPGPLARRLAAIAGLRLPRLSEPWTMQVALSEGQPWRVIAGTLISLVAPDWAQVWLPESAVTLYPPRADAVPPADAAVIQGPAKPDVAAAALLDALRYALPKHLCATLAGCAVVSADDNGSRLLGFAAGPLAASLREPDVLVAEVFADNPAGQGAQRTPVVLAFQAPGHRPETEPVEILLPPPPALTLRPRSGENVRRLDGVTANEGRHRELPHHDAAHRDVPHRDVPHRDVPHRDVPQRDLPHRDAEYGDVKQRGSPEGTLPRRDGPGPDRKVPRTKS